MNIEKIKAAALAWPDGLVTMAKPQEVLELITRLEAAEDGADKV